MSFVEDMVNQFLGNIGKTGQAIADSIREHVPTELGQDQIVDLGSEPEVPQVAVYVPETYDQVSNANYGTSNFANENQNQTEQPLPEITYVNSSGLKADMSGNAIRNSDGTYTDSEGHTIMADENGEPIMPDKSPEYYSWYKDQKMQLGVDQTVNNGPVLSSQDVDNDKQYLRDNQGMETVSLFNKVASLISSYSYDGVEAPSILSPSNTAFDNVEYAADGTVTETNPDGVSSDEAIQQSEDRIKVFNGIRQEFSDFFSNPIVENLPLILGGTVISTGIELQNSANPFGLSKGSSKAAKLEVADKSFLDETGRIKWPANNGFKGEVVTKRLEKDTIIDRYGDTGGSFVSPVGTSYEGRALPYKENPNAYRVCKTNRRCTKWRN